ncbi:MAG: hypothetical protein MJ124_06985 [Lachnospiraceae bacterium]|nr:hypothetical protein [Lachnospiraceae bacterium]
MRKISILLCVLFIIQMPIIAFGEICDVKTCKSIREQMCRDEESLELITGSNLQLIGAYDTIQGDGCYSELVVESVKTGKESICVCGKINIVMGSKVFCVPL